MSDGEVLIRAEHVSKKFCRSLKRSLWYGTQDVANSLMPWKRGEDGAGAEGEDVFRESSLRKDEFWAVRDVSFEVRRGECLGLIGHNGAGKSTLLKMLNSLNRPDSGRITMKGRVGALIELNAGFNPILTGRENIYNQAALLGFGRKETDAKFDAIVAFSELEDFLDMPVQNYSSGMRVRLGFAISSQMEPDVLLIDEVLAVGDAGFRQKCINAMAELMEISAVIFVSHSMPQIQRVCNRLLHLERGRVDFLGVPVSEGVGRYLSRFNVPDADARGDGSVEVRNLRLRNEDGEWATNGKLDAVQNGAIDIDFEVVCNQPLPPLVVQVLFWSLEMIPALEFLDAPDRGLLIHGGSRVGLHIDDLSLSPGTYTISVIVMREDIQKTFLHLSNAASVIVRGDSASAAMCVRKGKWTSLELQDSRIERG